eukprot:5415118-Amphidinium_carterae.1
MKHFLSVPSDGNINCLRTPNCKVALHLISAGCVGRVCAHAAVAMRKQSTGRCGCVKARMCCEIDPTSVPSVAFELISK